MIKFFRDFSIKRDNSRRRRAVERLFKSMNKFGTNLNRISSGKSQKTISRVQELRRIFAILGKRNYKTTVLVGPRGVGKFTIIIDLVQKILKKAVPSYLFRTTLFMLDFDLLIEVPEAVPELLDLGHELDRVYGEKLCFVIKHPFKNRSLSGTQYVDTSRETVVTLIKTLTDEDEGFPCILTTTPEDMDKVLEENTELDPALISLKVEPPSIKETTSIVNIFTKNFERHHGVSLSSEIVAETVSLTHQYVGGGVFPGKALDILDDACALTSLKNEKLTDNIISLNLNRKQLEEKINDTCSKILPMSCPLYQLSNYQNIYKDALNVLEYKRLVAWLNVKVFGAKKVSNVPKVEIDHVSEIISEKTGIPREHMTIKEAEKLLNLEHILHKRIVGQSMAVSKIANAVRRAGVGLRDTKRPIASFIFAGTTGVGKTELAKTLAEYLFGSDTSLIRFDMSEYMSSSSVSQLIGAPPGYVGYGETGQLTGKIKDKPYSIVLFDEMEKGHPDIFNLLLQVLDDGILTDSKGYTVRFSEAIIILTSNVGALEISKHVKQRQDSGLLIMEYKTLQELVKQELEEQFRPEFLNRLDDIIVFTPLTKHEVEQIGDMILSKIVKKLQNEGIALTITPSLKAHIITEGYDPQYGARPLRRAFSRVLEGPLADKLLSDSSIYDIEADLDLRGKIRFKTDFTK